MSDGEPFDWATGSAESYWDPVPWIPRLIGRSEAAGDMPTRKPDEVFRGKWEERNRLNVPGPIYGAQTDNCWVGRLHAPRHVLYGDDADYEMEFLYRQPKNLDELRKILIGCELDPFAGWGSDGDDHWTPELVRAWWHDRGHVKEWIARKLVEWQSPDAAEQEDEVVGGLWDYATYLDEGLELDLQRYCFWLDNRFAPAPMDVMCCPNFDDRITHRGCARSAPQGRGACTDTFK